MIFINAIKMIKISTSERRRAKQTLLNKKQLRKLKSTSYSTRTVHTYTMHTYKKSFFLLYSDGVPSTQMRHFSYKLLRNVPCSSRMSLLS